MYMINNIEYKPKERYSLKDWGKVLEIMNSANGKDEQSIVINLLAQDKITDLLNIILDTQGAIINDIYEEDFDTVNKVITDFFSRKKSLMKNTTSYSAT